ncbi:MAG TPA: hypothetical protein GX702_06720 [Chloroflexi bacterium]|nr:hypothetical protein [Chloroflexota bacterium]
MSLIRVMAAGLLMTLIIYPLRQNLPVSIGVGIASYGLLLLVLGGVDRAEIALLTRALLQPSRQSPTR